MKQKLTSIFIILLLIPLTASATVYPTSEILQGTADYIISAVPNPTVSSTGGEWAIIALTRSGLKLPEEYVNTYLENLFNVLTERKGILHSRKYTEYSRVSIALTSLGKDPCNFHSYNLLSPLADFDKTVSQGINGAIWALIALDCGNHKTPEGTATRKMYVQYLLSLQLPDGGWALSKASAASDVDITAMALCALSDYQGVTAVKSATENAINFLSLSQTSSGGFISLGIENCESTAQVITALCELKIPLSDPRFIKQGISLTDNLLSYRTPSGGFCHIKGKGEDLMATEQAFYALVAASRQEKGKPTLYSVSPRSASDYLLTIPEIADIINMTFYKGGTK